LGKGEGGRRRHRLRQRHQDTASISNAVVDPPGARSWRPHVSAFGQKIPVWWTQFPDETALLTGWFGGPKTEGLARLDEDQLINAGLGSLVDIFQILAVHLKGKLVVARAINWGIDPFAGGAYSYVTPQTREALTGLASPNGGSIYFCGEAFYSGTDMGTVEAALTSGPETARSILGLMPN